MPSRKGNLAMPPQALGNGQVGLAQTQQFGLQHPVLRLVGKAYAFAGARLISGRAAGYRRHRAAFLCRASSQMAQPSTRAKTGMAKKPTTANIEDSICALLCVMREGWRTARGGGIGTTA